MVRIHPDPPVSPGVAARGCSSVGRAPALQAGGRRFDPVQLHQPCLEESIRKLLYTSGLRLASAGTNRLLFNNLEGKAFMELDESFMDKKG